MSCVIRVAGCVIQVAGCGVRVARLGVRAVCYVFRILGNRYDYQLEFVFCQLEIATTLWWWLSGLIIAAVLLAGSLALLVFGLPALF
jgi:hypothetical protein